MWNNSTRSYPPVILGWTAVESLNLAIAIIGGLLNGSMCLVFLFRKSLHTPFTVYLINLLIANFIQTACTKLSAALLFVSYAVRYSHAACDFYMMTSYLSMAGMINTHALISLNRLWAVTFPHSYKVYHSTPLAIIVCVVMWLYTCAMLLPQLVRDSLYYRLPIDLYNRCLLNNDAQSALVTSMQLIVYVLPELFVLLTFPVIWSKRKRSHRVATTSASHSIRVSTKAEKDAESEMEPTAASNKQRTKSMTIFVLLMLSMFICWTPLLVPTFVACFVNFKSSAYFRVTTLLFTFEAIIDPILFGLVFIDSLWSRVRRIFRFVN